MSHKSKRKITVSLLAMACVAVVVALCMASGRKPDKGAAVDGPDTPVVPIALKPVATVTPVAPPEPEPPPPPEPPKVDVVFVLDTTGSMSGLIEGAKRKIWAIANQVLGGQPKPHVRIGLIGYRDHGDDYVTRRYQLTENVDDVYAHLRRFRADGGGDTPEHVNRALFEAIHKMQWRKGQNILRQIYLVGDAPPHEGRDGLYSRRLAQQAQDQNIIINAVRCGTMTTTAQVWRRIATAAGGKYASIRQDGGMVAVASPYDRKLAELNAALSSTLLPTGGTAAKRAARRRAMDNASMDAWAQAESAKYRARSGRLDSNDLLTVLSRGKKLGDMREAELPAPVAALPAPARQAYVDKMVAKRAKLKREISDLSKKRDGYIKAKRPKTKGFDDTIGDALKEQGAAAGLAY
jgi:hypothetical protein